MSRSRLGMTGAWLCLILLFLDSVTAQQAAARRPAAPATSDDLFQISKVWTVHLTFSPESWKTLTPIPSRQGEAPHTDGFRGPEGKRNGKSALSGIDFQYVHATFDLNGYRVDNVGVRYKGNGTYRAGGEVGKYSFKVDLNKYVKGQQIAGLTSLNLHSNITDASWMNEVLAFRLYRDFKSPAPRTSYARVFVTVPGTHANTYLGLFSIVEDVDSTFARARFGTPGGAVFKPVTETLFRDLGSNWARYVQTYDPKTTLTSADQQRIIDLCNLVTFGSDQTFAARLGEFIDVDAFARYMAVLVWIANPDSLLQQGQNYYLYLNPTTRQLTFMPWDQDHSFGQFLWSSQNQQQQLDILHPWTRSNRLLERTFVLPSFRQKYLDRLAELARTLTMPERLWAQVDELAAAIGTTIDQEPARSRIPLFKRAVVGESYPRPFYGGTVTPLKPFVKARQASVLAQLHRMGK